MNPPVFHPDGQPSETFGSTCPAENSAGERICYHTVYLVLATLVLVLASLLGLDSQDRLIVPGLGVQLPANCVSHQFFGWECPGCGLTRGFVALMHGQWKRAWLFNPGVYVVLFLVATQIPYRAIQIRRTQLGIPEIGHPRVEAVFVFATVLVLFCQWIVMRIV